MALGAPKRAHLESTAPPSAALPRRGGKWKQQSPFLPLLQPSGLGGNAPPGFSAARSWLSGREAAAGYTAPQGRGREAGGGRGRAGRALTSSTVSGMQIRYSFSSMVLPAADHRSGKRGGGPRTTRLPPRRRAGSRSPALGAGLRNSPGGALSSWLPPLLPRACQGLGQGVRGSPAPFLAEVGPPRNAVLQSQGGRKGAPLETAPIRSPGR